MVFITIWNLQLLYLLHWSMQPQGPKNFRLWKNCWNSKGTKRDLLGNTRFFQEHFRSSIQDQKKKLGNKHLETSWPSISWSSISFGGVRVYFWSFFGAMSFSIKPEDLCKSLLKIKETFTHHHGSSHYQPKQMHCFSVRNSHRMLHQTQKNPSKMGSKLKNDPCFQSPIFGWDPIFLAVNLIFTLPLRRHDAMLPCCRHDGAGATTFRS